MIQVRDVPLQLAQIDDFTSDVGYASNGDAGQVASAPRIISRLEWGADESLGIYHPSETPPATNTGTDAEGPNAVNICNPLESAYPGQFVLTNKKIVDAADGEPLLWPRQYSSRVKKIVIHHTAESVRDFNNDGTVNVQDYGSAIRAIYAYHTLTRKWGDIGYHYIVDPDGNIYEGRAGGNYVIGAHVLCQNSNTVGISLMGNFQEQQVPEKAFIGLVKIVKYLSDLYHVNPLGKSSFRGTVLPNIVTHAEIGAVTKEFIGRGATQCPGSNLIAMMPRLRQVVDQGGIRPDYGFSVVALPQGLVFDPLQDGKAVLRLKNIGALTWSKVQLTASGKTPGFLSKDFIGVGSDQELEIAIPIAASFDFGVKRLSYSVQLNDSKQRKKIEFSYRVNVPIYRYELNDLGGDDALLLTGEKRSLTVSLKNTGNFPWLPSGKQRFQLRQVVRGDQGATAVPGGLGYSLKDPIPVGGQASFAIDLLPQKSPGRLKIEYLPSIGGDKGLKGSRIVFSLSVEKPRFDAEIIPPEGTLEWQKGATLTVNSQLTNRSNFDWDPGMVSTQFGRATKQVISQAVKKGESVTIPVPVFSARAATQVKVSGVVTMDHSPTILSSQRLKPNMVRVQVEFGKGRQPKVGRSKIQTSKSETSSNEQNSNLQTIPPIRVWLSGFDQSSAQVTSSEAFVVWDSKTVLVHEHAAGETVSVSTKDLQDGVVIRIKAKDEPALTLTNWTRSAANSKDNQFRNVLEFRMVDGKLTVINELSLEDYLKGVAEEPESADIPQEKRKVMAVLARSYALHYLVSGYEKFPDKPYTAADSPAIFQKYLGYGFELRAPKWQQALVDTEGEVVLVDPLTPLSGGIISKPEERILRTAYFSCTDGERTKTPAEVGWKDAYFTKFADVFQSVDDPLGDDPTRSGLQACGHQVGLSGYGATQKAKAGENYRDIIHDYYQGVEVGKY